MIPTYPEQILKEFALKRTSTSHFYVMKQKPEPENKRLPTKVINMSDRESSVATSVEEESAEEEFHTEQRDKDISSAPSSDAPSSMHSHQPTPTILPKRRRVTRACDECRRKKIKCDGKQSCTHCTVYSYGGLTLRDVLPCCRHN